jgi:hypothetical protein
MGSVLIIFIIRQLPFDISLIIVFRVSEGGGTKTSRGLSATSDNAAFSGDSSDGNMLFSTCFSFGGNDGNTFCP